MLPAADSNGGSFIRTSFEHHSRMWSYGNAPIEVLWRFTEVAVVHDAKCMYDMGFEIDVRLVEGWGWKTAYI